MLRDWIMPKLGLTMTDGVLAEWTVAPGARFNAGDCVFVVENDKAASEIAAERDGIMGVQSSAVGETVPVGAVLGYWDDDCGAAAAPATLPAHASRPAAEMPAAMVASTDLSLPHAMALQERRPVTPWARKLARQRGIELSSVTGSGPRGRVRARDVEAAGLPPAPASGVTVSTAHPLPTTLPAIGAPRGHLKPLTPRQQAMAARLTAVKQEIPHFYLAREAEVSNLLELHDKLKDPAAEPRLTLNHYIVAAVGRALRSLPELNRVWTAQGVLVLDDSDVGLAVHTEHGLLVPVLRDVGRLGLAALARQANTLAERARAGRLGADEMAGGAITVSNAGMAGLASMTSIIVPGQSMILGVGGVRELFRPDAQGQPTLQHEIMLTLSVDHRVLDGVSGAALLHAIVDGLTHPTRLLFEELLQES
ncbi:dihydrolipoamide acetyltransferase family protein [Piscinibacter sakaiensis]|uniref:dihydrolipoamide acetyltransferase family protein n=1 Tax=Piscinibacter sakaiensis TaxID=1547922 RepID=UPI003AADEC3C